MMARIELVKKNQTMTDREAEYTLRMLNEALEGKRYRVTPQLLKELKEKSKKRKAERLKNQQDDNKA